MEKHTYGIEYRAGVIPSGLVSCGGARTRCTVLRMVSFDPTSMYEQIRKASESAELPPTSLQKVASVYDHCSFDRISTLETRLSKLNRRGWYAGPTLNCPG